MEDSDSDSESSPSRSPSPSASDHFEFGGPAGAVGTMAALPFLVLGLYYGASKEYKFSLRDPTALGAHVPQSLAELQALWSGEAFLVVLGWFSFQVLLERVLFSDKAFGVPLPDGTRLAYRVNGHLAFWTSLLVLLHGFPQRDDESGALLGLGAFPLAWIYDHYVELAVGAMAFSWLLSCFLFMKSYAQGALLAKGGDTSSAAYNFFIGRELNPRIGSFDIKEFCELRPGLIGWAVINAGCAAKQYALLGCVTPPMILINLFQGLYVWDALYHERCILTTMDITTDGFGWMLCFGDLAWVPVRCALICMLALFACLLVLVLFKGICFAHHRFHPFPFLQFAYSLQARYLVENSPEMSAGMLALICLLKAVGYAIFRGSNAEKDAFRRDPDSDEVAHLEAIETASGRKLLVSGWWGMARKVNYTGDIVMALAWCMTTGFDCVLTYFYVIYFAILLIHRAYRDDHACSEKYGDDWVRYKERVPALFVPHLI